MSIVMESDRRRFERIEVALVAALTGLPQSKPRKPHYLLTKNICDQGVFFLAKESPGMNSSISAELALSSHGLHLTLNGEIYYGKMGGHVVRHDSDGFAVAFDDKYSIDILHKESTQICTTKGGR